MPVFRAKRQRTPLTIISIYMYIYTMCVCLSQCPGEKARKSTFFLKSNNGNCHYSIFNIFINLLFFLGHWDK